MKKLPKTHISRSECRRLLMTNLGRILQEKGITALTAAAQAGVCYRVALRAIKGQTDPSLSLAISLARSLGTTVEELVKPDTIKKSRSSC